MAKMSLNLKINGSEIEQFATDLKSEASNLKKNLEQAMRASALDIQTTAKRPGYVPYKTGNLRRSITHQIVPGATISAIFGSNLAYARIHEFGGQTGRGGRVTIKASRYLQRAIEDNEDALRERIRNAIAIKAIK